MAIYDNTVLLEARAKVRQMAEDKFLNRVPNTPLLRHYLSNADNIVSNLASIRNSSQQSTYAELWKAPAVSSYTTEKTCSPSGDAGDTEKVEITWNDVVRTIAVSQKRLMNNDFSYSEVLAKQLLNMELRMLVNLEADYVLSFLDTNKTTSWTSSAGYFDTATDELQYPRASLDTFYNHMSREMLENDYPMGPYIDVANAAWESVARFQAAQGQANDENLLFQYQNSDFQIYPTNNLSAEGYDEYRHYMHPEDAVAMAFWTENDKLERTDLGDKEWTTYEFVTVPGLVVDLFITDACSDTSATGGAKQDIVTNWEFTSTHAMFVQPTDTTGETPILEVTVDAA